jgi:hypothetical protein
MYDEVAGEQDDIRLSTIGPIHHLAEPGEVVVR